MPLNASGPISLGGNTAGQSVNLELGRAATAQTSMNETAVRTLFGVASGAISMSNGYGKSNRVSVTVTLSANTTNYTLGTAQIPGYVAGSTDVTLVINNGIYVYSTNTANAGLTIAALNAADTVTIINNGFILGMGGLGGGTTFNDSATNGAAGGPALTINRNVSITNNSYIAGGGGGGGGQQAYTTGDPEIYYEHGGGGGAGGGPGGSENYTMSRGAGGGPGLSGGNGVLNDQSSYPTNYISISGGGGGRILPGTGGTSGVGGSQVGKGGGSGGGGAAWQTGAAGGSANNAGGSTASADWGGGGGGGWGAAGGSAGTSSNFAGAVLVRATGGAGGKAVNLNGFTATFTVTGTRYGAIS